MKKTITYAVIMAVLLAAFCVACATIGKRLDEQHKAQERYIQAYQQDLKREAKDNE